MSDRARRKLAKKFRQAERTMDEIAFIKEARALMRMWIPPDVRSLADRTIERYMRINPVWQWPSDGLRD